MPKALILYHYFWPDTVVSAQHFTQLAQELQNRGWQVAAMPCNRGCRNESKKYPASDVHNLIEIHRVWRPRFHQATAWGRILNAIWMIFAWSCAAWRKRKFPHVDVLIVGTDPILSVVTARIWKLLRPKTQIVHWCFDLYPEAAVSQGILKPNGISLKILKHLLRGAYAACDLIVDIGACMRHQLEQYNVDTPRATLTPWALIEPSQMPLVDNTERNTIFGSTKLGVLYSGNFGLAHSYDMFAKLIDRLADEDIKFAFSIRGNRADELRSVLSQNHKHTAFVPFASLDKLESRLSAADIHLVCLRPEWTGTVVASKFFGSLASGRPVIFAGRDDCALAQWIAKYRVGWVLSDDTLEFVTEKLIRLSHAPQELKSLRQHCYYIYHKHFSRKHIMDQWDTELRNLLNKTLETVKDESFDPMPGSLGRVSAMSSNTTSYQPTIKAHAIIDYGEQSEGSLMEEVAHKP